MEIGVIIAISEGGAEIEQKFSELAKMGMNCCQVNCWNQAIMTDENAYLLKKAAEKYDVEITALWCGWSGGCTWNFYEGPHDIGLVPQSFREIRTREILNGADFAKKIGIRDVITHFGFIPEVPTTTEYYEAVVTVKRIGNYLKENGQRFLFETGQETPVTLRRLIEDAGTGNLGINLDAANLIVYGKANPVDALDVFGEYVYNTHLKDGFYPKNGHDLGEMVQIGEGKVNYPVLIPKLRECGYTGPYIIEYEVGGQDWYEGVRGSIDYLKEIL